MCPGLEWPLMIDGVHVQWVSEQIVGLTFFRVRQSEQQRLDEVISNIRAHRDKDDAHSLAGIINVTRQRIL